QPLLREALQQRVHFLDIGRQRLAHLYFGRRGRHHQVQVRTHRRYALLPQNRQLARPHWITSPRIDAASLISASDTTSGGSKRMTFSPALVTSSPRSYAAATNGA